MKPSIGAQAASPQQPEETPLQSFASICGTLVVGLFILTFVFQNFMIPSAAMAGTLLVGGFMGWRQYQARG